VWQSVALGGTVSDRIAQQILGLINSEEIKPGDRLPSERDLAGLLGVSRPSVREAVKALEAQGWLRVRHGQGVFVAQPPTTDLRAALSLQELTPSELFLMREVLEVPAADWAAAAGDAERIAAAAAALGELDRASEAVPADHELLQKLDATFHMRIAEAAGNRFLQQMLGVLQEMLAASGQATAPDAARLAKTHAEHERLLDALRRGDSAGARTAARRHIRTAQAAAMRLVPETDGEHDHAREPLASGHSVRS
jgi:GntR family transcriptional repressor for pyruvate dehydrogenase complex